MASLPALRPFRRALQAARSARDPVRRRKAKAPENAVAPYLERMERQDPPQQGVSTEVIRRNWTLIAAVGAAVLSMLIAAFTIGFAVNAGAGDQSETVKELTGLVKDVVNQMSEMQANQIELQNQQAERQAEQTERTQNLIELGMWAVAVIGFLTLCGVLGGAPGFIFGLFALAGIAGVMTGVIKL